LALDVYFPSGNKIERFFYPGTLSSSEAKIFDVAAPSEIKDLEFKLPLSLRDLRGSVEWSNGTPAKIRGWVEISRSELGSDPAQFDWKPTTGGQFTFQALDGLEYWVYAKADYFSVTNGAYLDKTIEAKPIKLKVTNNTEPLKIILSKPADFVCNGYADCPPTPKK
jgi:hypothetical protein